MMAPPEDTTIDGWYTSLQREQAKLTPSCITDGCPGDMVWGEPTCSNGCDHLAAYNNWRAFEDARPRLKALTTETPVTDSKPDARRIVLVCAEDVEPEEVQWLWDGWLPFGKLVVIDGAPGVGKTALILDLIARASRGDYMPGCDR